MGDGYEIFGIRLTIKVGTGFLSEVKTTLDTVTYQRGFLFRGSVQILKGLSMQEDSIIGGTQALEALCSF